MAELRDVRNLLKRTPMRSLIVGARSQRSRMAGGPAPHAAKARAVQRYASRYGLRVLVETGTYQGEMVAAQLGNFDRILSVELDDALYDAACRRFSGDRHVTLFHGDSGTVLSRMLNELDGPALFWLDAHYSGGVTARAAIDTPIGAELDLLLDRSLGDVILIDDARMFDGTDGYPEISSLKAAVRSRRRDLRFKRAGDIIVISPVRDRSHAR